MDPDGLHLEHNGYQIVDDFLTVDQCRSLLQEINDFREEHTLPEIHRRMKGRSLRYQVIQGKQIRENLPSI